MKLETVHPGSIFEKLGLQVGDEILSINGKKLDSIQSSQSAYADLRTAGEAKITFRRNATVETRTFIIR